MNHNTLLRDNPLRVAPLTISLFAFTLLLVTINETKMPLNIGSWLLWTTFGTMMTSMSREANGRHSMLLLGVTIGVACITTFAIVQWLMTNTSAAITNLNQVERNIRMFAVGAIIVSGALWVCLAAEDALVVLTTSAILVMLPSLLNWRLSSPIHNGSVWFLIMVASLFELIFGTENLVSEKFPPAAVGLMSAAMVGISINHYLFLR